MSKKLVSRWKDSFSALRREEKGAEATEIIFVLAIFVLGMFFAFRVLKDKIVGQADRTGDCLASADTAVDCK